MTFKNGDKVRFIGATDEQVSFGGGDDPRSIIKDNSIHEVIDVEVHSWHTKLYLRGVNGAFNSVCFELA